jgi:hypothetical protein
MCQVCLSKCRERSRKGGGGERKANREKEIGRKKLRMREEEGDR